MKQLQKRHEVKTEDCWNLSDIFSNEEKFWACVNNTDILCASFKEKFENKNLNKEDIKLSLCEYENLIKDIQLLSSYVSLHLSVDHTSPENSARNSRFSPYLSKWQADLSFYLSYLNEISEDILTSLQFEDIKHTSFWRTLIRTKKHRLSAETEKVLKAYSPIFDLPYSAYECLKLADMQFPNFEHEEKEYPMSYVLFENEYESNPSTDFRRKAFTEFSKTLRNYGNSFANFYIHEVYKDVTTAKLRQYPSVFEYILNSQEVSLDMYNRQIDIIMSDLAPVMRKYASIIKRKYNLDKLTFADLKVSVMSEINPKVTKKEAEEFCLNALSFLGEEYLSYVKQAFNERWIDWAKNSGKSTGGFCASPYGTHSYILLSWTELLSEVFTLIHELGHAVHFALAQKNNTLLNHEPSLYLIEAPSTINELFLTSYLLKTAKSDELKAWVLASMLANTYFHNMVTHLLEAAYQREVYKRAEKSEALNFEILCAIKKEVLQKFWGDEIDLKDEGELTWMRQPHYYMGLYSYTYSAGLSIGTMMSKKIIEEGEPAVNAWLKVLASGNNYTPFEFAAQLGLDLSKDTVLKETISFIASLVDQLDSLIK